MSHRRASHRRAALLALLAALSGCGDGGISIGPPPVVVPNPTSLALLVGTSSVVGLTVTGRPPGSGPTSVQWTTSTPGLLQLDTVGLGGAAVRVHALGTGAGLVTAAVTADGQTVVVHVPVTITAAPCPLGSQTITPAVMTLVPGASARFRFGPPPCGQPGDTLATWTSSDTLVAVVDASGTVTARRAGQGSVVARLLSAPASAVVGIVVVRAP
jgi:hypothetical protein